jgi:PPOX class probable F420-dependent enzyme
VNLDDAKIQRFLTGKPPKLLRLALISGGKPHVSSVWYIWKDGRFWINTSEDRLKVRALRRNPRVSLIIDTDTMPYKGIIVEGVAKLTKVNLEEIVLEIVKRYVPKRRVRMQFEELMKYPRILICIEPLKALDIMSYKKH